MWPPPELLTFFHTVYYGAFSDKLTILPRYFSPLNNTKTKLSISKSLWFNLSSLLESALTVGFSSKSEFKSLIPSDCNIISSNSSSEENFNFRTNCIFFVFFLDYQPGFHTFLIFHISNTTNCYIFTRWYLQLFSLYTLFVPRYLVRLDSSWSINASLMILLSCSLKLFDIK